MRAELRPGFLLERPYQARREMNEMEMKNSIGGVMYRHLLRLENTQSELNEQLLDTLNDFGLTKKTFITGENFITTRGIHIAEEAHKLQKRKYAGQPYMVHPLRVALLSIDLAHTMGEEVNHELAIGALMHDTIEDSPKFGPDGTGGAAFKKETVKNLFGSWSLLGHIAENIAADADAFDHNTAIEYGILNDTLYHAKLQHWRRAVMMRRRTIKAADRIDNVLDPISLEGGLVNPISIMAKKLAGKRENYIKETRDPYRILGLLLPVGSYLDLAVHTATNISERTITEEALRPDNWRKFFGSEALLVPLVTRKNHDLAA